MSIDSQRAFITDSEAAPIEKDGTLLGEQTPRRDSKYSFYRIYSYDGRTFALCYHDDYNGESFIFGHEIPETVINEYIEV